MRKHSLDNPNAQFGDGISHPKKNAKTRLYKLSVQEGACQPMTVQLKAESQRFALRYAKARWPDALIQVIK